MIGKSMFSEKLRDIHISLSSAEFAYRVVNIKDYEGSFRNIKK